MVKYKIQELDRLDYDYIVHFAENMRDVDKLEADLVGGNASRELYKSIAMSDNVYTAVTEFNYPICMFGTVPVEVEGYPKARVIWCIGTDKIKDYFKSFSVESRAIIHNWIEEYGLLVNMVADFNTDSIRWLKWLGAEFTGDKQVHDYVFHRFEIRRKEKCVQ